MSSQIDDCAVVSEGNLTILTTEVLGCSLSAGPATCRGLTLSRPRPFHV